MTIRRFHKVNNRGRRKTPTFIIFLTLIFIDCVLLEPEPTPSISWEDVVGKTWYSLSESYNTLNTVTFTQDTVYHWIETYLQSTHQLLSRRIIKGYVYSKGQVYVDGDGEVLYLFNVKWKEYSLSGAPVYDWSTYAVWWLASITEEGNLRWGDYDDKDEIQIGWEFERERPIELK